MTYPTGMAETLLQRARTLATALASDPGQFRNLPSWVFSQRKSTLRTRFPWLPYSMVGELESRLAPGARVFEYGGGGSTLWFADRSIDVTTVEHDNEWFVALSREVNKLPNCTLILRSSENEYEDYVDSILAWPDKYFDVIIVDGRERVRCVQRAVEKVRPGGILILDDTYRDRYLPAFEIIDWPVRTFAGLTPSRTTPGRTTVWYRPAASI